MKICNLKSHSFLTLLGATAAICLMASMPARAEQLEEVNADEIIVASQQEQVQEQVQTHPIVPMLEKGKIGSIRLQDPEGIYKFYKARNFGLFWTDKNKASHRAEAVVKMLDDSWEHGFNPANYHVGNLQAYLSLPEMNDPLGFELIMSDAVARYAKDLSGMRLSAKSLGADTRSWRKGIGAEEALVLATSQNNIDQALSRLEPQDKLYKELQRELKRILDDLEKNPEQNKTPIAFPGLIHPHKTHPTVKIVRERFGVQPAIGHTSQYYDDDLIKTIQDFQKANGLKPDGIIGRRTIEAINQGRRDKLVKVLANLERLRWMPQDLPDKYLIVNVPAMSLSAYENNRLSFEMPVIVGKESWPTDSFKTTITGIRFNPSWYVPQSIQVRDLLPELRQNPDALTQKNLQLLYYTSDGAKPISPRDVKWNEITEEDMKNFAMIQNPGDENPLGKIRVLMPNKYNIYLHDTNSPDLFTKDFRALSHGCIRLSEPRRIADFILERNGDWTKERLENILSKKNTIEVAATEKLPVFILYQTVWHDGNGQMIYGQDIYKSDEKLVSELVSKEKLPIKINL